MSDIDPRTRNIGGAVIAVLLIALGAVVIADTRTYGDADSAVFPRTVAIVMIVISVLVLLRAIFRAPRLTGDEVPARGSWPRRILLPAVMLASVLMMKAVGFVAAALVMFAGVLLVANHDELTLRRALVYGASGIAVVAGFYLVFRYWLMVPLP